MSIQNAKKEIYIDYIKVSDIYGGNWAFEEKSTRGRYPAIHKLKDIVEYHGGNIKYGNEDIPPVPLYKVNDIYYLEEGNHRLYTLKYLEVNGYVKSPVIKAEVCEFKYNDFLKESEIVARYDADYLLYDNCRLEYASAEQVFRFKELKNKLK